MSYLLALALLGATLGTDRPPEQVLLEANAAYDAADYANAMALYEQLIRDGYASGRIFYNLGNASLRAGSVGKAIASYRMALSRRPRDQDAAANLAFARQLTKDALAPAETSPVLRTLFFWHFAFSRRELWILLVGLNALFWGTLAMLLARRESELLRWTAVGLLLSLGAVGVSSAIRTISPRRLAVVQEREITAHSGTSRDTVVRFKLHEGTEARVVERDEDWLRIELPNGEQGWVEDGDVILLAL